MFFVDEKSGSRVNGDADNGFSKKVIRLGISDAFSEKYGSQDILMEKYGLNSENIVKVTQEYLSNNN